MDGDDHIWYWYGGITGSWLTMYGMVWYDTLHEWEHVELFHSCAMVLHSCFIVQWSILMHACQSSDFLAPCLWL
jgi:hypothetical protein